MTAASASRRIGTREITLRQLGHMDADLAFAEKIHWIRLLDGCGVDETIVWGVDDDAGDIVRATHDAGLRIAIGFYGKVYFPEEMRSLLDHARGCGADFVCLNGRGAPFSLEESGWSEQQMLDACVVGVREAKDRGLRISIGLAYSTQADPAYICEVAQACAEAGADTLYLPDSLGVATPEQMGALTAAVREVVSIPIEVHCHNDYGLATANAIASVLAGADVVETFVNGQDPERSGIASLDEVVVALELLYGFDTGIELDRLTGLSRMHEEMTGMRVADNKPVVGRRAFNYRVAPGRNASEPKRDHFYGSPKVVPFDPTIVGNERVFMLGKFSGPNEVGKRLDELGIEVGEEELALIVQLVRERGRSTKTAVGDDDLRRFVDIAAVHSTAEPAFAGES